MITRAYTSLLFAVILCACASPPYIPPEGLDAAKLTFTNEAGYEVALKGFRNGEDCSGGRIDFNNRHVLGPGESTTISISPDQKFSFYFQLVNEPWGYGCLMPTTLTPQKGMEYFSAFDVVSLNCDADATNPHLRSAQSLGSLRYVTHNNYVWEDAGDPLERRACGQEWATSASANKVFSLCYVSVTTNEIDNQIANVIREPSFTLRKQKQPWTESGAYCQ
jgi:hypothetical protein